MKDWVPHEWFERYSRRIEEWRIPGGKDQQEHVMKHIGEDGRDVLIHVWSDQAPPVLRTLPSVEVLRQTWV